MKKKLKRSHHKIRRVKMPKAGVLRIEAAHEVVPMVVARAQNVVDVIPVPVKAAKEPETWLEYLFGR